MFATRIDQENLAYNHQTTAAAKPLNQALGAKTPGNKAPKTPFRANKNDENKLLFGGKTGLKTGKKTNDNVFNGGKKGPGLDKSTFVTPAGPPTRAPLGMKTTNARGNALRTPGPGTEGKDSAKGSQKPVSPRLRRAKVKIHQAEPVKVEPLQEEPDIEYMPPRSIPLPDHPNDFDNFDFAALAPANALPALYRAHMDPVDAHGLSQADRAWATLLAETDKIQEAQIERALASDPLTRPLFSPILSSPTKSPDPVKRPTTLATRNAAHTTASAPPGTVPRFAMPTLSARARAETAADPMKAKHAAATAASRSTLGYSKGRAMAASARKPLSPAHRAGVVRRPSAGQAPVQGQGQGLGVGLGLGGSRAATGLEYLTADEPVVLGRWEEDGEEEEAAGLEDAVAGLSLVDEDDELRDFQLVVPEL